MSEQLSNQKNEDSLLEREIARRADDWTLPFDASCCHASLGYHSLSGEKYPSLTPWWLFRHPVHHDDANNSGPDRER
jgi:hypothetical protein